MHADLRDWVFPSITSKSGHVVEPRAHYAAITKVGGAKFWFHALRNSFITVAERELMLPRSLTKRLVNHARPSGRYGGLRRKLDGGAAARTGAADRRPHRRAFQMVNSLFWSLQLVSKKLLICRTLLGRALGRKCKTHASRELSLRGID